MSYKVLNKLMYSIPYIKMLLRFSMLYNVFLGTSLYTAVVAPWFLDWFLVFLKRKNLIDQKLMAKCKFHIW